MPRQPDRTLDVLMLFRDAPPEGLGVTEIAEALGLYKSMVHRILSALEGRGLVRQEPKRRRYVLGYSALALAGRFLSVDGRTRAALPALEGLQAACGAPAALYVADGPEMVCLCATGALLPTLGQRAPLLPGAPGLVLLAHLDSLARAGLLGALAGRVSFEAQALAAELEQVRRQGWAAAGGLLAAPVLRQRELLGAVALAAADPERCVPPLAAAAAAIAGGA